MPQKTLVAIYKPPMTSKSKSTTEDKNQSRRSHLASHQGHDRKKTESSPSIRSSKRCFGPKSHSEKFSNARPPKGQNRFIHADSTKASTIARDNLIVCTLQETPTACFPKKEAKPPPNTKVFSYSQSEKKMAGAGIEVEGRSINLGNFKNRRPTPARAYNEGCQRTLRPSTRTKNQNRKNATTNRRGLVIPTRPIIVWIFYLVGRTPGWVDRKRESESRALGGQDVLDPTKLKMYYLQPS